MKRFGTRLIQPCLPGVVALLVLALIPFETFAAAPGGEWWDSNYPYREKITVTAGSAAVPSAYSVSVTFDHAALVAATKSQADGDDIRIGYWNGASWVELDRVLDFGSAWNSTSTQIWFKLQAGIGASSSDDNYYVYYGNGGATNPPATPTNIFFFYDGYESGDFSGWSGVSAGTGDSNTVVTTTVHTGTYAAEAFVDPSGSSHARVENSFTGQSGFHSTVWVYIPTTYPAENDITVIAFYTGGWTTKVATLAIRAPDTDMRPLLGVQTESPVLWQSGSPALTTGAWHRLEMKVIVDPVNGRVEVWQDGVKSIDLSNVNTGTGNIDFTLENIFWKSATTNSHTLYFDDSFDRVWVDPEPTTALAAEEASGAGSILLVTPDALNLTTQDAAKKALIESWGYTVVPISA
ncbi:MAG: heparin lyase I family protein, partial [Anaerolineae bacterium]